MASYTSPPYTTCESYSEILLTASSVLMPWLCLGRATSLELLWYCRKVGSAATHSKTTFIIVPSPEVLEGNLIFQSLPILKSSGQCTVSKKDKLIFGSSCYGNSHKQVNRRGLYRSFPLCTILHDSFLLISTKFCEISLLHWLRGQCGKKNILHCAPSLCPKAQLWALKAHVHKTTYGPLIDKALYVMLLMRPNPLLGQWGGGWALGMDLPASKALCTGRYKS